MEASAPGKLILFGEHAVVYNKLGIATAIDLYTTARVEFSNNLYINDRNNLLKTGFEKLNDLLDKVENLKTEGKTQDIIAMQKEDYNTATKAVIAKAIRDLNIQKPFKLEVTSEIPVAAGLGSGSSAFAAISGALQKLVNSDVNIDLVENHSYFGDVVCHGTPSGIDNNAVTYGGYIQFRKSEGVKKLDIETKLPVVIGNTGVKGATRETVANVRKLRDEKPNEINAILDQMEKITNKGITEIEKGNLENIGKLMNQNQECLRKLGVSHPKLEELVDIALKNNCYGAKLTGGGGGGNMYALCKNNEHQKKVAQAFENAGYKAFVTKIGVSGVR